MARYVQLIKAYRKLISMSDFGGEHESKQTNENGPGHDPDGRIFWLWKE